MKQSVYKERSLIVDPKGSYLDDMSILCLHPEKLHWLLNFDKNIFDKAMVRNCETNILKGLIFFYIARCMKPGTIIDVYVCQPISVVQPMDAKTIESNARLAGFKDIKSKSIEEWVSESGKDLKITTLRLTMVRPEVLNDMK
jgi:hypothetical protein